jgi:hypothetical protein
MAKANTKHVVQLDDSDSNYQRWIFQMTLVLKSAGVWGVVSGESKKPAATDPDAVTA